MKTIFKRAVVIGGLLLSTSSHVRANNEFTDLVKTLAPVVSGQVEAKTPFTPREGAEGATVAAKYLKQRPFDMKTAKKIAGTNAVFTIEDMAHATDGSYILLRQSDLNSVETLKLLQSVLQKPTDLHIILDVEADSSGILNLHCVIKKIESDGSETHRRILPYFKHLHLINSNKDVIQIGQSFLYGDKYIEDITFTGFGAVERIEDGFMAMCPKLKSADLSSFEHLKQIDSFFMAEAKALEDLKLPTTRFLNADLTTVGHHFLRGASSLTRVQEEALESVSYIGDYFMSESGLTRFKSGKFKKLEVLGIGFLARCANLQTVDVSGLDRIVPMQINDNDVKAAEQRVEIVRSNVHAQYRQAWQASADVDRLEEEAQAAEIAASKRTAQALAIIQGTVAKGKARAAVAGYPSGKVVLTVAEKQRISNARSQAEEDVLSAMADRSVADHATTNFDLKVQRTEKMLAASKAAKQEVEHIRANLGRIRNLGVLHGCPKLKAHPAAIRGAGKLSYALRNQLHLEYAGLTYDDDFGCC